MTYTLKDLKTDLAWAGECQVVVHPFRGIYCSGLDSYRGYYDQPALRYSTVGNDGLSALELLKEVDDALAGKYYYGYKGGQYTFSPQSCIWIADYSEASGIQVTGMEMDGYAYASLQWANA